MSIARTSPLFGGAKTYDEYVKARSTFTKLPIDAVNWIAAQIGAGVRVARGSRNICYTQTTLNVLRAIIQRVDRARNVAQISYAGLMEMTGIKSRSTLSDHLYLLEAHAGFIAIERQRAGKTRNKVNVFRLLGRVADCVLDSLSPKKRQNEGVHSPVIGLESESMYGWMNQQSDILQQSGIEAPMLKRLIEEHGEERVTACVQWATRQGWAKNPAALAVAKIRDAGFDPNRSTSKADKSRKETDWTQYGATLREFYSKPIEGEMSLITRVRNAGLL